MPDTVRLNIIVEGQTEETFVRDMLRDHFAARQVYISARRVETGRDRRQGRIYRGGMTGYERAKRDIERWLNEDQRAHLTTMFDLYGLPDDFPNLTAARRQSDPYQKVRLIEEGMAADIRSRRFIPYVQLHEYEGLLFSRLEAIDEVMSLYARSKLNDLRGIRNQFNTPEEINDGATTAPSKRLIELYPSYDKVAFGVLISKRIGLETIRQECPHFNEWMSRIESLGHSEETA
ncbi:MAG TPA: DUF4276 family protein [Blastocatellia bacterium]|jgi:hypothetical protein